MTQSDAKFVDSTDDDTLASGDDRARLQDRHRGSSQLGMRLYNERLALSLIRQQGSLPKSEIARQTGLTAQTISVILKQLEADGLVRKEKPLRGRVGQPRVPISLNPDGAYSLGLKIGRRSSDLVLMDFVGNVKRSIHETFAYPTPEGLKTFVRDGVASMTGSLSQTQETRLSGIGIATPFELWSWVEEVGAPSQVMDQWRTFDTRREIEDLTGLKTELYNDATAACAAELFFGNPARYQDFLYVYIGSFVGGGVVLGGNLFAGPTGNAGAIGSMPVPAGNGTAGTRQLITAASNYSLEKRLLAAGSDPSVIWRSPDDWGDLGTILDGWIDEVSDALAFAVVSAISVIDFAAVLIDGAFPASVRHRIVSRTGEAIGYLDRQGLSPVEIAEGTLGGNARAVGGASLPLLANFAPDSEVLLKGAK